MLEQWLTIYISDLMSNIGFQIVSNFLFHRWYALFYKFNESIYSKQSRVEVINRYETCWNKTFSLNICSTCSPCSRICFLVGIYQKYFYIPKGIHRMRNSKIEQTHNIVGINRKCTWDRANHIFLLVIEFKTKKWTL